MRGPHAVCTARDGVGAAARRVDRVARFTCELAGGRAGGVATRAVRAGGGARRRD